MNWETFLYDVYCDNVDSDDIENYYSEFDSNPEAAVKEIFSTCLNSEGGSFIPEALDKLRGIAPVFERLYVLCKKPLSTIGGMPK